MLPFTKHLLHAKLYIFRPESAKLFLALTGFVGLNWILTLEPGTILHPLLDFYEFERNWSCAFPSCSSIQLISVQFYILKMIHLQFPLTCLSQVLLNCRLLSLLPSGPSPIHDLIFYPLIFILGLLTLLLKSFLEILTFFSSS